MPPGIRHPGLSEVDETFDPGTVACRIGSRALRFRSGSETGRHPMTAIPRTDDRSADARSAVDQIAVSAEAHARSVTEVLAALDADPVAGLAPAAIDERRRRWGRNELDEPDPRPRWLLYLDQFRNVLVALLVVGAIIAGAIGDVKDSIAIAVVLVFNATLGYLQEQKATRSLAALRQMLAITTRVRRGGTVTEVETSELVPGDVVLLEAGDRVPADARVTEAWAAEVDESSLTGESVPVGKQVDDEVALDAPLGDRSTMVFMNTQVTQGRITAVVTATGMATEVGKVAALITESDEPGTPLQRQLDSLGKRLAAISGAIVVLYFVLGLVRGSSLTDVLISAVALLVAAIPEGLPAVVTLTLAVGTTRLAKRGAIVKRLASVETLGSTSVICSDKTGTLTHNQMTARALWTPAGTTAVGGEGYDTTTPLELDGAILLDGATGLDGSSLRDLLEAAALCNDSHVRDGQLIGDPTEGALVSLAARGGVDVDGLRAAEPRIAEVPFDSARKFMVTVNDRPTGAVMAVKGAWEVVVGRCATVGTAVLDADTRAAVADAATGMAGDGLRVLAIASRPAPEGAAALDIDGLAGAADGLELHGLVGLLDPPRAEVRPAIEAARRAGIDVKMVTGDHLDTARAIAGQIGIIGDAVSGHDLDAMDDAELDARIEDIGVIARVSPQHKVRIVRALRHHDEVVAMTGDGVNDAAALSAADIGVAMGTAGTEVAKDAADMVLSDDNFTTITRAVEQGRTIYNNIVKFVRFQLTTNIGALGALIGAQLAALPVPFNPIQLLWINIIMDGPPAMALGVDPDSPGQMERPPRASDEQILSRQRFVPVAMHGLLMAGLTLGVLAWAEPRIGTAAALSLAFSAFVLMQVANAVNVRDEHRSAFSATTFHNRSLNLALVGVVALQVLVIHLPLGERIFGTVALSAGEWAVAASLAVVLILVEEVVKVVRRRRALVSLAR